MEPSQALRVSFELKDLIISLLERLGLCEHSGQKDLEGRWWGCCWMCFLGFL